MSWVIQSSSSSSSQVGDNTPASRHGAAHSVKNRIKYSIVNTITQNSSIESKADSGWGAQISVFGQSFGSLLQAGLLQVAGVYK